MASNNNFKADYDLLRVKKPEYDVLRIMLKDGQIVRPESIDRQDLFEGNVEVHWNGRIQYDAVELEELRDSIIAIGILEDISGFYKLDKDGQKVLVITDGHRRLFATAWARELGHPIAKLPVKPDKLEKGMGEEYYLLTQLKTNNGTKVPLTMLEQGLVVKRFLAYGHDMDEIVEQTGIKKPHLENCLALANTPGGIKQLIKDGVIAPTTIINAINTDKAEYRDVLDEALEIAEQEATQNGKDKVKVTSTHVKKAREKRQAQEMSVAEQAKLLEDVKHIDWEALPPSVLLKVNEIVRKHWEKK
jgi:ParB-like chromosome segregation protein Spo0J